MIFWFLFGLTIILLIMYCIANKIRIKWRTFLKKGFKPSRGIFGVYCYTGKQGKGKTFSLVEYLNDKKDTCVYFCNVNGITCADYFFYTGFEELLKLKQIIDFPGKYNEEDLYNYCISLGFDFTRSRKITDLIIDSIENNKQLVFVYDEIFTELMRGSKLSQSVMDFLCQMRKRKIIFLTTAQEWSEIPITFRKFCRYQIDCCMIPILVTGILIKRFNDAENMKWVEEEQEFMAPLLETTITHTRKEIADSYDTFLRVSSANPQAFAERKSANN